MKKVVLLAAMALIGTGALLAQEDITPAAYKFYQADELVPIYPHGIHGANLQGINSTGDLPGNASTWTVLEADKYWKDGLLIIGGGQYWNHEAGHFGNVCAGLQLVDLGGEIGKCFTFNDANSNVVEALKAATGYDYEITAKTGGTFTWGNLNFFMDPKNTPYTKANKIEVKITYNVYANNYGNGDNAVNTVQPKTMENGMRPSDSANAAWTAGDNWVEDPDTEEFVWDPTRWCEYTFITDAPDGSDEGKTYLPMRIAINYPGGIAGKTIFIREIRFTAISPDAIVTNSATKNFITLHPGKPSSGVKGIESADNNFTFSVNGNTISFSAAAEVFNMAGAKVAQGKEVTLAKGLYVARVGGKAAKVLVK